MPGTTKHITLRMPSDLWDKAASEAAILDRSLAWVIVSRLRSAYAGVAQRIEQAPSKSQVAGSIPAPSPKILRKNVPGRITNPEIVERAVDAGLRSGHDTKTCRIYGCLMCKALKA